MGPTEALLLGIVQGLTEFLPISSSAHLVLLPAWLHRPGPPLVFDTTVHLGTLTAVLVAFWPEVGALARAWWQGLRSRRPLTSPTSRLAWWLVLATLPGATFGFLFEEALEQLFSSPRMVGGILLLTALLLFLAERCSQRTRSLEETRWTDALWIGIGQAAAIAPGLSRSGTTIATGMLRGLQRDAAARFSFLLSIPIVAGTGVYQLLKVAAAPTPISWSPLVLGFIGAALAGFAAIRFLLAYLRRRPLYPFALYCLLLGLLALVIPL
jgi:undecaprenyl-diphosphatase